MVHRDADLPITTPFGEQYVGFAGILLIVYKQHDLVRQVP